MKNSKLKLVLWALALVCLSSLAFMSIAFAQDKKKEGKIHLKLEIEENGKSTKIDTTFSSADEDAIERYLEEKGINSGKKRLYMIPPVAPVPPMPPDVHAFVMPDMDFDFDFDFDFEKDEKWSKENKEKMDNLRAEMKKLKEEINAKITPELRKLSEELQKKRKELHENFKDMHFNFYWHDDDESTGRNRYFYYWNSDDDEREGRLPGERKMKIMIDGENAEAGDMKDFKVKVIHCEVGKEKSEGEEKTEGEIKKVKIEISTDEEKTIREVEKIEKPKEESGTHNYTPVNETGVSAQPAKTEPVSEFTLNAKNIQLFPNPNDGNFSLSFELPTEGDLSVKLLDGAGREVVNETIPAFKGIFSKQYNIQLAKKGTYLLQLKQGERWMHKKMVVK